MKPLKAASDFLLYTNVFIALCAVAMVFTNQLTINNKIWMDYSTAFVFFSTMFTYSALKFNSNPAVNQATVHQSWAVNNRWLFNGLLIISMAATAVLFFMLSPHAQWVIAALALVTAFYGFIPLPFAAGAKLRDITLLKTFFVALVWSVSTVIIPFIDTPLPADMVVFLLLRRFLFILALVMVFEIKDMAGDKREGLRTLPMVLGIARLKMLAQGILLLMVAINMVQYFMFSIPWYNMAAVNLSLMVSVICVQVVKARTSAGWYYLVLDGMMLLQFIFVYLAHRLFA